MEQPEVKSTKTRNIVIITVVGGCIILSGIGIFVPESQEYIKNITTILLGYVK